MGKLLWASFDGGGNVPPSIGIARELERAGHQVVFLGREVMAHRVRLAGFRAIVLAGNEAHDASVSFFASPFVAEHALEVAAAEAPDAVVIDSHFGGVLAEAGRFGVPTAMVFHSFIHRTFDGMRRLLGRQSEARQRAGFAPLPDIDELWGGREVVHSTSLAEFDRPVRARWPHLTLGGPVLEHDSRVQEGAISEEVPGPLVLVSFSTEESQGSVTKLQSALDALADLPLRVVATTSAVDPAVLSVPGNAVAVRYASHDALMSRAVAVVTHGGHGTTMRALYHGAPLLLLVGKAGDQTEMALDQLCVADFVEEFGVGVRVRAEADRDTIATAARTLLDQESYRTRAAEAARSLASVDGARNAAESLARLLERATCAEPALVTQVLAMPAD